MYRVIKSSEDFVVDYPLTDEYVDRTLRKYDRMARRDEEDYYDRLHAEGKYEGEEPEDIYGSTNHVDIERIFKEMKDANRDLRIRLVDYDDEVAIWSVNGKKCSLNFKYLDPVDVEKEIYDITESKLEGVEYDD